MKSGDKTYDSRCYDLAWLFVSDDFVMKELPEAERKKLAHEMAQEIQGCIEDFLNK